MPFQPAPNIASAAFHMTSDGQNIVHQLYFNSGDGWSGSEIIALAQTAASAWETHMMPNYPSTVLFTHVVATDLESLQGARAVEAVVPAVAGTAVGAALPNNVAFAVQLSTGNRGRGRQGRLFIGPLTEGQVTGDQISQATADELVTDIEAVANAIEANVDLECNWVVLSRTENGAPRPSALGYACLGAAYSNLYIDSQKLRLPGHKRRKTPTAP